MSIQVNKNSLLDLDECDPILGSVLTIEIYFFET